MQFTSSSRHDRRAYRQIHVRVRPETGRLYLDYHVKGRRHRQHTGLADTQANRRDAERQAARLAASITLCGEPAGRDQLAGPNLRPEGFPAFPDFATRWQADLSPQWREATRNTVNQLVDAYLIPAFRGMRVDQVGREDLFAVRSQLAREGGRCGRALSPKTVNQTMRLACRILDEAAERYGFPVPTQGIGGLEEQTPKIRPFTREEVQAILEAVEGQDRVLLTLAFYSGLRPGELAGLQWPDVEAEAGLISVKRTWARGRAGLPKSAAGRRDVLMNSHVLAALWEQRRRTGDANGWVFQSMSTSPVDMKNFASRVWHPVLHRLGLSRRRLYATRHTYASLMLGAGETPAWIARQLGHEDPHLLFEVYAHFLPDARGRDGAAFERYVAGYPMVSIDLEPVHAPQR